MKYLRTLIEDARLEDSFCGYSEHTREKREKERNHIYF
jgi:hypothetical protein